jgi:hypothetical protein
MRTIPRDLVNHRSGQLTVIAPGPLDYKNRKTWVCRCECGAVCTVVQQAIRSKRTRSCGCLLGGRDVILTPALAARFWEIVGEDRDTRECWIWPMGCGNAGYGVLNWKGRALSAHRVALAIRLGGVLEGRSEACHSCDRPSCVNPLHLRSGTHRSNHQEAVERGRYEHLSVTRKKAKKTVAK